MSNQLASLRRIIAPSSTMRGVVVEVSGAVARVATAHGMDEYAAPSGLLPGTQVTITQDGRLISAPINPSIYWL